MSARPDDQPRRRWRFAVDATLTRFELVEALPTSSGAVIATSGSIL